MVSEYIDIDQLKTLNSFSKFKMKIKKFKTKDIDEQAKAFPVENNLIQLDGPFKYQSTFVT